MFPRFTNSHLLRYTYDHAPIILEFFDVEENMSLYYKKKRITIFEQIYTTDEECNIIIDNSWGSSIGECPGKLKDVLHSLDNWGRQKFSDIPKRIKESQVTLSMLKEKIPNKEGLK